MVKKMLINAVHPEECRVAVVSDGLLEELDVQVKTREATLGNIYKGLVARIEPSLQAAFVDYGATRHGFLPISDVHPSYFSESFQESHRRPRIEEVFKKNDPVIVQVNKEERDSKGASLTTNISLAGRYLVLMPGTDLHGVSRKIDDEKERKKLRELVKQLTPPENMGFIIRTAGMGRTKTELSRDLSYLLKLWQSIEERVAGSAAPVLLYREHDVVIRSIRDHFTPDINEILVDDKAVFNKARDFLQQIMPRHAKIVKLYQERRPLFNKYQLEEQIEQVYRRRIKLKSGGYIVIEPTEALVTVDVNSGSATRERGIEETAFKVNMEAAPEIARQLRLRDLGGIIVIDFIDMNSKRHRQEVVKALKGVLKNDRAKSKVLNISALGLLELSRQRLKSSLGTGEYLECPLCEGRGKMKSPEMSALAIFRKIKSLAIKPDVSDVLATVPAKVAEYLLNNLRSLIVELEQQHDIRVTVLAKEFLPLKEIAVEAVRKEEAESVSVEEPTATTAAPQAVRKEQPEPIAVEVEAPEPIPVEPSGEIVDEAAPEERKRTRKPGRRRRWNRRKPASEAVEQPAAAGVEMQQPDRETSEELQEEPGASKAETREPPPDVEPEESETSDQPKERKRHYSLKRFVPFL